MSDMTGTSEAMRAYDEAQSLILAGPRDGEDGLNFHDRIEMHIINTYPNLNAQGIVKTILRRAYKDLAEI